jgi:hypothetical protein
MAVALEREGPFDRRQQQWGSLARHVLDLADTLTDVIDQAATRNLAVPPTITNTVHELRG